MFYHTCHILVTVFLVSRVGPLHGADVDGGGVGGGDEDDAYGLVYYLRRTCVVGPFDTVARYCNLYTPAPGSVETDNAVNPNIHTPPYNPVGYIPVDTDL